jgi:hypothetical protein
LSGELSDSRDDLGPDLFMAAGGRYRQRRFAAFAMREGAAQHKLISPPEKCRTQI